MKRIIIFFATFLFHFTCLAQSQKEIDFYKNKYYELTKIGADSVTFYNEKVFTSKSPIDLAFAYAVKWQILFITKKEYNEQDYVNKVNSYLSQVPETDENYYNLANIYSIRAQTYRLKEDYNKSLDNLLIAEKFATQHENFKQIIKIKSNLSTILYSLGKKDRAIEEIKKNITLIDANNKNGDLYLEDWKIKNTLNLGIIYVDKYNESKNRILLDSASIIFNGMLLLKLDDYYLAQANSRLGIVNNYLGNYENATKYYKKSIQSYTKLKLQNEIDIIVYNLGYNYYKQKKYSEAKNIFLDIIRNTKDSAIDYNYLFSHKNLADIYTYEKNDSAIYYSDKFLVLYSKKTETEKEELAKSYSEIEKKDLNKEIIFLKNENTNQHKLHKWFLIFIIILIASFSFFAYFFIKKRKATERKLNELISELKESKIEDKPKEFIAQKITTENERKIIEGLLKIEKEAYFLKKDFNLHNTAKRIGSNTTYLTAVIKNYKKMSFNDYTNELRINYILKELMVNEKLQNYTIQSLAEVVGYKNGASFSKIFKLKTGVTPFQFIEKIKQQTD